MCLSRALVRARAEGALGACTSSVTYARGIASRDETAAGWRVEDRPAAVGLGDRLDDRQAEAGAGGRSTAQPLERLGQALEILGAMTAPPLLSVSSPSRTRTLTRPG